MSKETVVSASRTSEATKPGRRRIEASRLTIARCGTSTPFGRPVEPEV